MGIVEKSLSFKHSKVFRWVHSLWFLSSLATVTALAMVVGFITRAPLSYLVGQLLLGATVYISSFILSNQPLINPIQAVIFLVYWWFGVGPIFVGASALFLGKYSEALHAQTSGMESLWIVVPGLILYSIVAKITIKYFSKMRIYARFLLPKGENYRSRFLIFYLTFMAFSILSLIALRKIGLHGQEEVSFLGGKRTTIWWVGAIAAIGSVSPFLNSALMSYLANNPWKAIPRTSKILIATVIILTISNALFGGWKSPIAILGVYYVCAYISRYQRPPWGVILTGGIIFLVIITPFVSFGRQLAIVSGATDSATRKQVFTTVLKNPRSSLPDTLEKIDISVFFRGIYPLAGELTRRNKFFDGEWGGYTIAWGIETVVPRAFNPGKRDSNIGNFFARTVGADIGVSNRSDFLNSIAISIPFEFVGNYGWLAGVLSFGLIGFLWSLLVIWMLSPTRLANHPLSPFLTFFTMSMESPLGSFLAGLRGLLIPIFLSFLLYKLFRGRI